MASIDSMKKDELLAHARTLAQELKKLIMENEELKNKTSEGLDSPDCLALAFSRNDGKYQVHLMECESKAGKAKTKETFEFQHRHMAEFKALELINMKVLKGELK